MIELEPQKLDIVMEIALNSKCERCNKPFEVSDSFIIKDCSLIYHTDCFIENLKQKGSFVYWRDLE